MKAPVNLFSEDDDRSIFNDLGLIQPAAAYAVGDGEVAARKKPSENA